jgi:hypothetical protein
MTTLGYATDGSDSFTAAMVGATAAQAVFDYRHVDGSNQANNYLDSSCRPAISRSTPPTPSLTPTTGSRCGCPTAPCRGS